MPCGYANLEAIEHDPTRLHHERKAHRKYEN